MGLVKVEVHFAPGTHPHEPRRTDRDRRRAELVHRANNFSGKRAKVRKMHFREGMAMEFANCPFRFVGNFPCEKSGLGTELAEQGNQDGLQKSLSSGGELQNPFSPGVVPASVAILHPEMVHQGKAQLQPRVFSELESDGHILEECRIRAGGNSSLDLESAAAIPEQEPAHYVHTASANLRKILCNSFLD